MKVDALSKYYSDEQLNQVINVKPKNRITIGYCRISNHKQKDDLERQIDNVRIYLQAKGQPFEIISDIGSGINYKENKLQYAGASRFAYNWVLASEKENYEKGGRFISDPELRK
ncbi:helix-turn-helix domain-containing protein [Blautia faecis]|nr:helix-turn-helix domain-containing protein [Blautia faecis]